MKHNESDPKVLRSEINYLANEITEVRKTQRSAELGCMHQTEYSKTLQTLVNSQVAEKRELLAKIAYLEEELDHSIDSVIDDRQEAEWETQSAIDIFANLP
tara:strand:- start:176 stop:478 length:303 start_codon:yes stop_codon:yes gene_type:complete